MSDPFHSNESVASCLGNHNRPGEGVVLASVGGLRELKVRRSLQSSVDRSVETVAFGSDLNMDLPEVSEDGFPGESALIGETLGQYRLDKEVGRGSMGRVYRAAHLGLHRACAIKVLNPGLVSKQPAVRERFWAEARAVAHLLHPHVVTIHNLGSDRGYHFIEMEYIPGGLSLRESIIRSGPLDTIQSSTLLRQVSQALDAAHKSGLIHRDVKPANVLINDQGHAKLADFGLVRKIGDLNRVGVAIAGTPTYMAPELFEGITASPASDIYAVGVMYYYLLSARLPYASDKISQLILRHRSSPIPDIREIVADAPDAAQEIIERCLAKRPGDRFGSAAELADAFRAVIHELRDTESLIRESVDGIECFIQGARDRFRIVFTVPGERLQEVYVEANHGPGGERLISIFSVCGPADPQHFEFALRLNDRLSYGSLSVRNVNGEPMFVMNRTFSRDHICSTDIRAALLEIARRSDRVEQQLTNADFY